MKNDHFLAKYFKHEEKKARKRLPQADPSSWPEYLTATQSRIRRVMAERKASPSVNKVGSSVESMYLDETAQDVAHSQVSRARRGKLPRKITPTKVLAWGGWGIIMTTFASSLLLNFPFGVGAFVLKSLPGEPREGVVLLTEASHKNFHPGDTITVKVSLAQTNNKKVKDVGTTLSYDPGALELQEVDTSTSDFSSVLDTHYEASKGKIYLALENEKNTVAEPVLATLSFKARAFIGQTQVQVIPDTHIAFDNAKTNIPKTLSALTLKVSQKELSPVSVALASKKDAVTIDGDLSDWRDVIAYNPASFKPSGTILSNANLKDGRITSEADFTGVLQVAQNDQNMYLSFSAADDEVLEGDKIAVKFGSQLFEIPIVSSSKNIFTEGGVQAKTQITQGGYVVEVAVPKSRLQMQGVNQANTSFNFEVHDIDSQDSADVILSYPNDSVLKP